MFLDDINYTVIVSLHCATKCPQNIVENRYKITLNRKKSLFYSVIYYWDL